MEPRSVEAGRGWHWIAEGVRLFLRSPAVWLALVLILYLAMRLVQQVPILWVLAALLMPVFVAGLMDGCRALEAGQPLEVAHLLRGFQRNAAPLVTIGGVSLVGNVLILMLVAALGGEAFTTVAKTLSKSGVASREAAEQVQAATAEMARAALIGTAASLPLLMALWFAPLLAYFHNLTPWQALRSSFLGCLRNMLAMLVYGLLLFAVLLVLVPIGARLGQYDLGFWLLAPVLLPSIYASYKDIYLGRRAPAGVDRLASS